MLLLIIIGVSMLFGTIMALATYALGMRRGGRRGFLREAYQPRDHFSLLEWLLIWDIGSIVFAVVIWVCIELKIDIPKPRSKSFFDYF